MGMIPCHECAGEGRVMDYTDPQTMIGGRKCWVCAGSGELPNPKDATVVDYRSGDCRNDQYALSHTYAMMSDDNLWPMCGYGWNRSGGQRFSIFRGTPGTRGDCKLCLKNIAAGKAPVFDGFPHKTRYL